MDLILWRHAEAEDIREGQADIDRALTPKGRRQATKLSLWLRSRLPSNLQILASPARRTQETATHLGLPFTTDSRLSISQPESDPFIFISELLTEQKTCLLIGHQPMLGKAISKLLRTEETDLVIKKGSVWWFSIHQNGEVGSVKAVLNSVINPKDLDQIKGG